MKKKSLLLFAPLAVFALALPSCGNNKKDLNYKLQKRDTYDYHSDWTGIGIDLTGDWTFDSGFAKVAMEAYENQGPTEPDPTNEAKRLIGPYELNENLKKATITTKAEIHVDGEGTIFIAQSADETRVIDLSDLGGTLADIITTEWDVGAGYLKSTDSLGGYNYILREGNGNSAKYWRCLGTKIKDKQYRYDITDYVKAVGGFDSAVILEQAINSGNQLSPDYPKTKIRYEGLDISSFGGYDKNSEGSNEEATFGYENTIDIGTFLLGKGDFEIEEDVPFPGLALIDAATMFLELEEIDDIDLIDCTYDGDRYGKKSTKASLDVGFKDVDLSIIKDIVEGIEEELPLEIPVSKGKGTLDYFISYENNFVHQQEILIDVKDTDFVLAPSEKNPGLPIAVDLKGVDLTAVINEDVKANTCKRDNVKLDNFVDIESK